MSISQAVGGVFHVCQLVLLLLDVHCSQSSGWSVSCLSVSLVASGCPLVKQWVECVMFVS